MIEREAFHRTYGNVRVLRLLSVKKKYLLVEEYVKVFLLLCRFISKAVRDGEYMVANSLWCREYIFIGNLPMFFVLWLCAMEAHISINVCEIGTFFTESRKT